MSQFYDQASLVMVPSGYKAGKVYSQKPLTTDGQLTFSRASTATRVNASGLIESVASGVPRLDYSGGATCGRLLLEPQRTNSIPQSEPKSGGEWLSSGSAVIVSNATMSPQGYQNAAEVQAPSGSSFIYDVINIAPSTAYTTSFYIKNNNATRSQFFGPNESTYSINWNGAVITSVDAGVYYSSIGNDWYRVWSTQNSNSDGQYITRFYPANAGASVYLWGYQVEAGSYATSYIPTLGASVTRLADAAYKTGISSLIGQTEGTLFVEFESGADDATNHILSLSDGTTSNRVSLVKNTSDDLRAFVASGGASQASILWPNYAPNTNIKAAISYKANEIKFYANGENAGTDTSAIVPASLTQIEFETSGSPFAYPIKQLIVFPTALSATELATLTA